MRLFISSIICLLLSLRLNAQQADIVKPQAITLQVHKENIGQIIFTSKNIPASKLGRPDFLSAYQLTNKSNLFISVFMGNSLTNYMHALAPGLSADSLDRKGNFQFTLFVDDKAIYSSNLNPGAPYAKIKDTATIISKPLIDNEHEGVYWSQFFWVRFLHNGGDNILTEGKHLLRMEIRPYIQLANGIKVGDIIASGQLNLEVYLKPKIDPAKISLSPVKAYNGFAVSHEKFDQNKIKVLKGNIDEAVFKKISSVVVIKKGKILIEEYFNGETRDSLHDPRSVGKSFASGITGMAIRDGYLKNEFMTLKDFYDLKKFDNYSPEKENVSLKDLLTMSSPFDGNDDDPNSPGNEENMYPTPDWVKFALGVPVNTSIPAGEWHYFTAGVVILGDILNKTIPGGMEKYADQKLFKSLGINDYHWEYTPQHVPNTAGGIRLNALDFAKFGQLYENTGISNGRQIIPKEWVVKSFTRQKQIPGRSNEYYGYLFWNKTYHVDGKDYETWYCSGNGGNSIFIFPSRQLVIVITATAYGMPYAHPQVDKIMEEYLLPAVAKD